MKFSSGSKVLIAKWRVDQDSSVDLPYTLIWSDGSPATLADFHEHKIDTHSDDYMPNGIEMRMYPDICADVRYDAAAGSWAVYGVTPTSISLDLPDPAASDHQIEAQLSTLPTVYKARIWRNAPTRS
jgi:hypothetical protein